MTHVRFNSRNCMPAQAHYPASNGLMNWFRNDYDNYSSDRSVALANIVETKDDFRLELSVPGFSKSDFRIKLDGQILTISADGEAPTENQDERYVRHEFSREPFGRSFRLTNWVDSTRISAKFENGILLVHIPKVEVEKAKPASDIAID